MTDELEKIRAEKMAALGQKITDAEEQFEERKLWNKINIRAIEQGFFVPSLGFKVNENSVVPDIPPPNLGQDTDEILKLLEYTDEQIKKFKRNKIVN